MNASTQRLPPKDQLVMGVHAIEELLKYAPQKILKIYTTSAKKSELFDQIKEKKIPIVTVSIELLNKMTGSDSHQLLVAHIQGRTFLDVKQFIAKSKKNAFVLMLDEIFDPQNFGALLRSAECFGVDAVAWSKNRGSDITPVVAKTSCGASELIDLIRVSNLAQAVDEFQKNEYQIVAAQVTPGAISAYQFSYQEKTVLIVGSEGAGIRPLLQKKVDRSIYLPMQGKIESLNVAQATAALLALRSSLLL